MCLILLARDVSPDWPLVLAANRDEFFARPARPAHYWEDAPGVLGGRDLEAGGSWLGMDTGGRLAAVTNYREPPQRQPGLESRGRLVADYLREKPDTAAYLRKVLRRRHRYAAFNLLLGRGADLYFYSSRAAGPERLGSGIHGISNGDLDCPWPKVHRGGRALREQLETGRAPDSEALLGLLADDTPAPDEQLPDTGVGLETERKLSPIFISLDGYGTRSSTVIIMDTQGVVSFTERNYAENGTVTDTHRFEFRTDTG